MKGHEVQECILGSNGIRISGQLIALLKLACLLGLLNSSPIDTKAESFRRMEPWLIRQMFPRGAGH